MQDWLGQVRSMFPVSTDNWCKLHFDWMIKRKQYRFLRCQQIGKYDIRGYIAVLARYVSGGDGVHMTTAGKAGLALPHHMATGGPNELTHTVILKAKMSYGSLSPCNAKSMGQIWKLWDIFSDYFITYEIHRIHASVISQIFEQM